jgi:hypothetical protein
MRAGMHHTLLHMALLVALLVAAVVVVVIMWAAAAAVMLAGLSSRRSGQGISRPQQWTYRGRGSGSQLALQMERCGWVGGYC